MLCRYSTVHVLPNNLVLVLGGTPTTTVSTVGKFRYYLIWDPANPARPTKVPFDSNWTADPRWGRVFG